MKKALAFIKKYKYWIMLYLIILTLYSTIGNVLDDIHNLDAVERFGGFFTWLYANTTMWSGRVVPAAIFELIIKLPNFVFSILNSAFYLILIYGLNKTFAGEELNKSYWPLLEGVLLQVILSPGIALSLVWKSAAVFYLWGTGLSMFMLYPFVAESRDIKVKNWEWVLCGIGIFYATSFEQIAAFDTVFAILLVLWNKIYLRRKGFVTPLLALLIAVLSVIFVSMPGNAVRTLSETLEWLPYYGMYTLDQKIVIGLVYTIKMYMSDLTLVMLVIATAVCALILRSKSPVYTKVISVIVDLYFLGALMDKIIMTKTNHIRHIPLVNDLYKFINFDNPQFVYKDFQIWNVIIAVTMLVALGYLLFIVFSEERPRPDMALLFYGGACCTMIIGFSPTIYMSGDRVKFIGTVFTIFIMYSLIKEFIKRIGVKV